MNSNKMKRSSYRPIRRRNKRIYQRSIKDAKKRKRLFFFFLILVILLLIFIPGHNGLIKLTAKRLKIQKLHNEIENLKIRIELVRAKIARSKNPEYIKRYAHDRYGMVPKSDTLKDKTPSNP